MSARIVEWADGTPSVGQAAVAIGVFDGVHVGHVALITDTVTLARESGLPAVVITFDRDPEQVVSPDKHVPQLLSLEDKLQMIGECGADVILVIPFCMRLAEMAPERFVDDVLMSAVAPVSISVGHDFRFGRNASGTVATLTGLGETHGFTVRPHALVNVDGEPVTATRIRALIAAGEVQAAAALLGRPHRLDGRVVHGRGEGAPLLGIPTANIIPWHHGALPAEGVYAGAVVIDGTQWGAAISVGLAPSFPQATEQLEVHVIDFEGDLYDKDLRVEFFERMRAQRAFDDPAELSASMHADIARAAKIASARLAD